MILIALFSTAIFGRWHEDYQSAYEEAKKNNKDIFLFFTGSDYCPWCKKLSKEILDTNDFKSMTDKYFEFVLIDFPAKKALSDTQYKHNKKLKEKYKVEGFPTVIIIDTDGIIITRTGYLPIGPKEYAKKIIQLTEEHNNLKKKDLSKLEPSDLKKSYEKARSSGNDFLKEMAISEGIKKDDHLFFLLEKYAYLLEKKRPDEAKEVRKEIVEKDPYNLRKAYFKLAMIDFQILAKDSSALDPHSVIHPLVEYISEFGKKDRDNLWRLEMLISQFLSSKGLTKEALKHARESYKAAPQVMKKELVQTVIYLKNKTMEE